MDQRQRAALVAFAIVAGGAWWWSRQRAADAQPGGGDLGGELEPDLWANWSLEPIIAAATGTVYALTDTVQNAIAPGAWSPPAKAAQYLPTIYAAEDRHGIPRNLFARLIEQECRWREDIISGRVKSGAGAIGIAQIVPKWHPGVDPYDPIASINYAAGYLAALRNQFGTWALALAAYNWGPGNLAKYGFEARPEETRNYVAQITTAVGVA